MSGVAVSFVTGLLAGMGVAMPLGAVGVLVVGRTLDRGFRTGLAAGTGVALSDGIYAVVATAVGGLVVAGLAEYQPMIQSVGAVVLLAVAARGLLRARRPAEACAAATPPAPGPEIVRFLGLTVINPVTAIYFTALSTRGPAADGSLRTGAAFCLGVLLASWTWHLVLVTLSWGLRRRLTPGLRRWTIVAGHLVVVGLAIALLVTAGR